MSKIAEYLQEHLSGEVITSPSVRSAMSTDAGLIQIVPEIVVFPRTTDDIRKVARFCWQLADKGHILPITMRGGGSDQTSGAIGSGVIISTPAHLNTIFEYDPKQRLIRLQPGANAQTTNDALRLHGACIPSLPPSSSYSTIGGAVANNATGQLSGVYGDTRKYVSQLEVILANGEVIVTRRLNKRELSKKIGLQTFEGEIYRAVDGLIEENIQLIKTKLGGPIRDNAGYDALSLVKHKDGSFDLTPLFAASQGTLGIIAELIMKTEFVPINWTTAVAAFDSPEQARDCAHRLRLLNPTILNIYDAEVFNAARQHGRSYPPVGDDTKTVLIVGFSITNDRARKKKMKKITKIINELTPHIIVEDSDRLLSYCDVTAYLLLHEDRQLASPPVLDGAYIPSDRLEDFTQSVATLAQSNHVTLPLYGRMLDNIYYLRPTINLDAVGDKQKIFKLLDEYSSLVTKHGGHIIGEAAEGRLAVKFANKAIDEDVQALFTKLKTIFDPHNILNPGVKQDVDVRELAKLLRPRYDFGSILPQVPTI